MNALIFANIGLCFVWPQNDAWTGWRYFAGFGWLEHTVAVWLLVLATGFEFLYPVSQLSTKPALPRP